MKLPGLGIIALIGLFVLNIVVTKNYFFNYIKKCISEGYVPESEESRVILSNAGILLPTQQNNVASTVAKISKESTQTYSQPTRDFVQELEKLANLKEKGILTQEEFEAQKQKLLNN
ncbi:SHOCT domain-containing protein [Treponema denticola]|nr:SHOCT domain-containing protein [Treponema denticola]